MSTATDQTDPSPPADVDPSPVPSAEPTPEPTPEPSAEPTPSPSPSPTPDRLPGIDISKYDGDVDMHLVWDAGVRFVIIKSTQGSSSVDPWYSEHVADARAAGLAIGSYHFFDYRRSGVAQADNFVDTMLANGALMDTLPPVVDVECSLTMGESTRATARTQLRALVDRVYQRTGRLVMIYTSAHMWGQVMGNDPSFGGQPLWVACWRCGTPILPSGWNSWAFWQIAPFHVPGITRAFDGDVVGGGDATLAAFRSKQMVVADDAPLSHGGSLPIEIQGLDGSQLRTSTDDQTWSDWIPRAAAHRVLLDGPDGLRHVRVQPRDSRGTTGPIVSDTITIDSTAPVVQAPRIGLRAGSVSLGASPIPVRLTWSVIDDASGVVSADFNADCGGTSLMGAEAASERTTPRQSVTGTSVHWVASGTRCVSSATVVDAAGNQTTTGDIAVTVRGIQETPSSVLTYSRGWRSVRTALAFGGTLRTITSRNQWVRLRFSGSEIALVSDKARNRGRVRIIIDGVQAAVVDLRSSTLSSRRIVFHKRLRPGRHTIEVRTLGSARQPRRPARVDIDGFLVIGP